MTLIMGAQLAGVMQSGLASISAGLVDIPAGTFRMGNEDTSSDFPENTKPVHDVALSAFQMGKNVVTNGEYQGWVKGLGNQRFFLLGAHGQARPFIVAQGSSAGELNSIPLKVLLGSLDEVGEAITLGGMETFKEGFKVVEIGQPDLPRNFDHPQQPVINVNWYQSVVYALMHLARLATEAENEYASRGPEKYEYGTRSGSLSQDEAHYNMAEGTADVGSKPANGYGLHDMCGNVWEWCMDWYGNYEAVAVKDPTGPVSGQSRVLRGGSWFVNNPEFLRAACRGDGEPGGRDDNVGFRLVVPRQGSPV